MDVSEDVRTLTLTVMRADKTKTTVEAEIAGGMAVYLDPDRPDRLRLATQTGRPLLRLSLTKAQMLRATLLIGAAVPEEVKSGERSLTAWKREERGMWSYYDQIVRHITMSVQLGDWG